SPPSSVLRTALTERPACFEIDPRTRAVKQRLGCGSPTACAAATFSDRSPLHDVRQRARRRLPAEAGSTRGARNDVSFRTSVDPAGGARRDRTDDLLLAKQALSQLSYGPDQRTEDRRRRTDIDFPSSVVCLLSSGNWWAWEDLNFRPHAYQARALPS